MGGGTIPHPPNIFSILFQVKMQRLKTNKGQEAITGALVSILVVAASLYVIPLILDATDNAFIDDFYTEASSTNSTVLSATGEHNLTLTTPSDGRDASLAVVYVSCGATENVSVNTTAVGQLDGTSPDAITVDASLIGALTTVGYELSASCNITSSALTYYQDGNYAEVYEDTSGNAVTATSLATIVVILIGGGMLIVGVSQWMRS